MGVGSSLFVTSNLDTETTKRVLRLDSKSWTKLMKVMAKNPKTRDADEFRKLCNKASVTDKEFVEVLVTLFATDELKVAYRDVAVFAKMTSSVPWRNKIDSVFQLYARSGGAGAGGGKDKKKKAKGVPEVLELDREALKDCMLAGLRATKRLRVLSNAIPSAHKSTTGTKKKDKAKAKAKAKGKDKAKGKAKAKAKGKSKTKSKDADKAEKKKGKRKSRVGTVPDENTVIASNRELFIVDDIVGELFAELDQEETGKISSDKFFYAAYNNVEIQQFFAFFDAMLLPAESYSSFTTQEYSSFSYNSAGGNLLSSSSSCIASGS